MPRQRSLVDSEEQQGKATIPQETESPGPAYTGSAIAFKDTCEGDCNEPSCGFPKKRHSGI